MDSQSTDVLFVRGCTQYRNPGKSFWGGYINLKVDLSLQENI
jgi:hypothetical protein